MQVLNILYVLKPIQQKLASLWKFSRPHTIIGTTLSVLGLYLIAQAEITFRWNELVSLSLAMLSCWAGNIYIVGLNQIIDLEIDRINKPCLPLAAGTISVSSGIRIVAVSGISALILSISQGAYLFFVVGSSIAIGTAYSSPPLRLKRYPFWASMCIFVVRGFIINVGLYLHFTKTLSRTVTIPPHVWALTIFILGFSLAIAWFKDIPDIEGDRYFKIYTFALRFGPRTIFKMGFWLLTVCYISLIIVGMLIRIKVNPGFFLTSHAILLVVLWLRKRGVIPSNKDSMAAFYQFIWKLFYLEYVVFPLSRLLA